MFSRSLLRSSSRVLRPGIVATGRPFHSSAVVCTSWKEVAKEATKDFADTSPEHAAEISNPRNEPLTGGTLGTSTGRIADEKSGSTPGYTPNVPNPHNPNPKTWKDYPSAGKSSSGSSASSSSSSGPAKPTPPGGRTTASTGNYDRTNPNATSYNPTPGTTSGTGTIPGEPGATRPIPSAPGSPAGASASRTTTNATNSTGNNPTPGIPTRKYSTERRQDSSSSSANYDTTSSTVDTTGIFADINAKIGGILGLYGAPTFTKGDNVVEVIKSDHRKVEALYSDYQKSSDKKQKQKLAQDIIKNLVQHSEVEQMLVYPLLKMRHTPNGQSLHDRSLSEHQEVRELLYKLDQTSFDDPSYDAKLKAAMDANKKHVEEEESETLPLLSEKFSADELQYVGGAFEKHKWTAPTHPHPSAPMQGPLAAAAGMAAKPLDLARDAAKKVTGK